ncbi:MAG: LamG domain-containing protein [Sedimentisphaerales bacterium]|nr:LamG domain-containing protein [Sedimentisphaerales bacterium]
MRSRFTTKNTILVLLLALVSVLLAMSNVSAELIVNGSFESPSPAGWPPGFTECTHPSYYEGYAPAGCGSKYGSAWGQTGGWFSWGSSTQVVDLAGQAGSSYTFSAWLSAYVPQNDYAEVELDFYDGAGGTGISLGSIFFDGSDSNGPYIIGSANSSGNPDPSVPWTLANWTKHEAQGYIPAGTLSAVVTLSSNSISGNANDSYIDLVSLVLNQTFVLVTISGADTEVTEGGATDSYEIRLGVQPTTYDVIITATPGDAQIDIGNGPGAARTLTFTSGNWDATQTITVMAVDDEIYEGAISHTTTITHTSQSSDEAFNGIPVNSVDVEVIDDELPPLDNDPPLPDPMNWEDLPQAAGSDSVTMSAVWAFDLSGVEYYFECTGGGGNDSGWQTSTVYTDTGLLADTQYTYRLKARDQSSNNNETGWSGSASATTDSTPVITDGLISYWPFDEGSGSTAPDVISSHDGSLSGDATWASGKLGGAVDVGHSGGGAVTAGAHADFATSAVSVQVWANIDSWTPSWGSLLSYDQDNGASESGWTMYVTGDSGVISWRLTAGNDSIFTYISASGVPTGQWVHLVATYDGVSTTALYVNGSLADYSGTGGGGINWNYLPTEVNIGRYHDDDELFFINGITLDEVAIWDRAITTDEIAWLYNSGSGNSIIGRYVIITETGDGPEVTEGGSTDSYEIVLGEVPTHNVEITATPIDAQIDIGNGAGAAKTLTFTSVNWDTAQTITITAVDDEILERQDDPHTTIITHTSYSEDEDFNGLNIVSVEVLVHDNELTCGDWGYLQVDINEDCFVNLRDYAMFALEWLKTNE